MWFKNVYVELNDCGHGNVCHMGIPFTMCDVILYDKFIMTTSDWQNEEGGMSGHNSITEEYGHIW